MSGENSFEINLLNEVYSEINDNDIDAALEKLENYIENNGGNFEDDEYHVFDNPMELELFNQYFSKQIKPIPPEMPIKDIYYTYGFLLLEVNQLEKAQDALLKALKFNPVSPIIIFELMEVHKRLNDYDSFVKCLGDVFNFAYTPHDLARAYRYLGFFSIEIEKFDLAVSAYVYSLKFDNHESAYQELAFLKNSGHDIDIDFENVVKILQDNDIPLAANSFIVSKFRQWGDEFAEEESFEEALNMYGCAYSIDDSLENQMRYKMTESILNGRTDVEISL